MRSVDPPPTPLKTLNLELCSFGDAGLKGLAAALGRAAAQCEAVPGVLKVQTGASAE